MKILIIEDDMRLGDTLLELLKGHDMSPELVDNGTDGYEYARSGYYDMIILDVMLPGMDGYEVVTRLRKEKIYTPVLMLTAKGEWPDKVRGLDAGADDYLTKPFIPEELFARIRALSRRKGAMVPDKPEFMGLTLEASLNRLEYNGKTIPLPAKEAAIMKLLLTNPGQVITKNTLIDRVWDAEADTTDNNVEVYISFLRKKLRFLKADVEITTVRKVGYLLEASSGSDGK